MAGKGTVGQLLVEMRADLGKLRVDVKEMESVFKSSFTNIQAQAVSFGKTLLASFGIGFGVGQVIAFGKSILDLGSKLSDLSVSTGISIKALSGIKSTLEESGTSVETLAKGFFKLQAEIGNSTKATDPIRIAIDRLGLSWEALTQASPEELLKKVTDALAKQENPLTRNALAQQLLKKTAAELVPAVLELAGKFDELKKQGLDEADAKKLDDFGDALTRLKNSFALIAAANLATTLNNLQKAITDLADAFKLSAPETENWIEWLNKSLPSIQGTERELLNLAKAYNYVLTGAKTVKQFFSNPQGLFGPEFKKFIEEQKQQIEDINDALSNLGQPSLHTPAGEPAAKAGFTPPVDTDAIKKATDALNSFLESLAKQKDALGMNIEELLHGGQAAKEMALDLEFAAFKAKLAHDNLKVPADARAKFDQLKASILGVNQQLEDEKNKIDALKVSMELIDKAVTDNAKNMTTFAQILKQIGATGLGEVQKAVADVNDTFDDLFLSLIKFQDELIETGKITPEIADKISEALQAIRLGRAIGVKRAEVGATPAGADPAKEARERGEALGAELANSMSSGLKNTLLGIETGDQSIGEGMKNLVRNMMLELQGVMLDKAILAPLKEIAEGFMGGLAEAMNSAADTTLKDTMHTIGMNVGGWLKEALGSGGSSGGIGSSISSGISSVGSWISSLFMERGGMIPSFASGGLFIGHGGEFVMQKKAVDNIGADTLGMMNKTGKMPGSGGSVVNVEINGDITPRQPNMTPDQIIKVTAGNITNDGMVMSAIEQRMRMKGR